VITAITGGNAGNNITTAVTATASFNTGLNALATGLTNANALTADIYVVYNDGATNNGTDRQVKITPKVKDCACCGAWSYTNGDPTQPKVWLEFLCHNLGADETKDPFKYHPTIAGNHIQWGRRMDGHEVWNSKYTDIQASTILPNHEFFIEANTSVFFSDWTTSTAVRWGNGVTTPFNAYTDAYILPKGPNDPCPAGWKVPTTKQWASLFIGNQGGSTANGAAIISTTLPKANIISAVVDPATPSYVEGFKIGEQLFLPFAGLRWNGNSPSVIEGTPGTSGQGVYWAASLYSGGTTTLSVLRLEPTRYSPRFLDSYYPTVGASVRCVIDK
jgi:hypothetical protein